MQATDEQCPTEDTLRNPLWQKGCALTVWTEAEKILVPLNVPTSGTHVIDKIHTSLKKWASLVVQLVKNPPAMQETLVRFWVRDIPWRRDRLPALAFFGFPFGSAGKESTCNAGDLGSIPGLGSSPGEGNGYPLQHSCLENSKDRGAWQATVDRVTKSQIRLRDFHFTSS